MNKQLRNFLKLGILIVGISLLLLNCEKESIEINNSKQQFTITKKKFVEFNKLPNLISKVLTSQNNAALKSNESGLYSFTIDSSSVTAITDGDNTWYTLKVFRQSNPPDVFEKLIISEIKDSLPKAELVKYFPNQNYINSIVNNEKVSFSGGMNAIPLDYNRVLEKGMITVCTTVTYLYCPILGGPAASDCAEQPNHLEGRHETICTTIFTYEGNAPAIDISDSVGGNFTGGGNSGGNNWKYKSTHRQSNNSC